MVSFKNSFFSISGQVERIKNVGAVLSQSLNPFSKNKPTVDTNIVKNPVVAAAATALVQHPFATAAVVATPFSSTGRTAVVTAVKALPTSVKVVGAVAALPVGAAIASSSKLQAKTIEVVSSTPNALVNLGSDVGRFVDTPTLENAKSIITENKAASAVVAGAAIAATGFALAGPVTTYLNTRSVKENTDTMKFTNPDNLSSSQMAELFSKAYKEKQTQPTPITIVNTLPATPTVAPTPIVAPKKKKKVTKKKKKKTTKKKKVYKKKRTTKKRKKR